MTEKNVNLEVRLKGGGSMVAISPVFSENAEYVYIAWKNKIISYNTKTAKRLYEFRELKKDIVGFGNVCADGIEYTIACANDGTIITWKANIALKLRELKLKIDTNIEHFKVFSQKNSPKSLVCTKAVESNNYIFNLLNLSNGELSSQWKLNILTDAKLALDIGSEGQYYAVVQGQFLYCNDFGSKKFKHTIKSRKFTCVACHPEENIVLTGDDTGRVLLWNNIFSKNPTQTVFHWHTLPVETLSFSTSGTYFYSGADECVLVKWDQLNSNSKNFLPRLSAPIKHISVAKNNVLIAVATEDNSVQIIDPQLHTVNVIQHLALSTDNDAGIVYDPRTKMLVLKGIVGHVQFFSPKDFSLAYNLDVVCQNKYTNERNKNIISTTVSKIAIDDTGLWMATTEQRCGRRMFDSRLKFWFFHSEQQKFMLNTCIEYPHDDDIVIDVLFQPSRNEYESLCITIGKDKKCRIWQLAEIDTVHGTRLSWNSVGEIVYKNWVPRVCSFTNDGSLIALGFESTVTLWVTKTRGFKADLSHPLQGRDIIHASFGCGSECHLLFTATPSTVNVWNLLTLRLIWVTTLDVSLIASHMLTSVKAVFTTDKKIHVFNVNSGDPVYSNEKILKNVGDVQIAKLIPKAIANSDEVSAWDQRFDIYFLNSNNELYSIETNTEGSDFDSDLYIGEKHSTMYGNLLPQVRVDATSRSNATHLYRKDSKVSALQKFLDTPTHLAPPVHTVVGPILMEALAQISQEARVAEEAHNTVNTEVQQENQNKKTEKDIQADIDRIMSANMDWAKIF